MLFLCGGCPVKPDGDKMEPSSGLTEYDVHPTRIGYQQLQCKRMLLECIYDARGVIINDKIYDFKCDQYSAPLSKSFAIMHSTQGFSIANYFSCKLEKLARKPFGDKIPFSAEHVQWNRLSMPIRKQRKKLEAVGLAVGRNQPHKILWQGEWVEWRGEFHPQQCLFPSGSLRRTHAVVYKEGVRVSSPRK